MQPYRFFRYLVFAIVLNTAWLGSSLTQNLAQASSNKGCATDHQAKIIDPKPGSTVKLVAGDVWLTIGVPQPCNNPVVRLQISHTASAWGAKHQEYDAFENPSYNAISDGAFHEGVALSSGHWYARVRLLKPELGKWSNWHTFFATSFSAGIHVSLSRADNFPQTPLQVAVSVQMGDLAVLKKVSQVILDWEHFTFDANFQKNNTWTQYWPGAISPPIPLAPLPANPLKSGNGYQRLAKTSIPVSKFYPTYTQVRACIKNPLVQEANLVCSDWVPYNLHDSQAQVLPPTKSKSTLQGRKNIPGQGQTTVHFGSKVPANNKARNNLRILSKPTQNRTQPKLALPTTRRATILPKLKPLARRTPRLVILQPAHSSALTHKQRVSRAAPALATTKLRPATLPDLLLINTRAIVSRQCQATQAVRVQVQLKNRGSGPFPALARGVQALYATTSTGLVSTGISLPAIAAGAQLNRELVIKSSIPMAALAGKNIPITVQLNQNRWLREANYSNNKRTVYAKFPATYCAPTTAHARRRPGGRQQAAGRSNTTRASPSPPAMLIVPMRSSP